LILENTFTSILDMAGVILPFLKWFIGGTSSKGPKLLNFLVRSPWSTIDVVGQVRLNVSGISSFSLLTICECKALVHMKTSGRPCQSFVATQRTSSISSIIREYIFGVIGWMCPLLLFGLWKN
jgi:hypothetical protein